MAEGKGSIEVEVQIKAPIIDIPDVPVEDLADFYIERALSETEKLGGPALIAEAFMMDLQDRFGVQDVLQEASPETLDKMKAFWKRVIFKIMG